MKQAPHRQLAVQEPCSELYCSARVANNEVDVVNDLGALDDSIVDTRERKLIGRVSGGTEGDDLIEPPDPDLAVGSGQPGASTLARPIAPHKEAHVSDLHELRLPLVEQHCKACRIVQRTHEQGVDYRSEPITLLHLQDILAPCRIVLFLTDHSHLLSPCDNT